MEWVWFFIGLALCCTVKACVCLWNGDMGRIKERERQAWPREEPTEPHSDQAELGFIHGRGVQGPTQQNRTEQSRAEWKRGEMKTFIVYDGTMGVVRLMQRARTVNSLELFRERKKKQKKQQQPRRCRCHRDPQPRNSTSGEGERRERRANSFWVTSGVHSLVSPNVTQQIHPGIKIFKNYFCDLSSHHFRCFTEHHGS